MKNFCLALIVSTSLFAGASAFASSQQDALCHQTPEESRLAPAIDKVNSPCVKHDIDPKLFRGFWNDWKMVTTHYRTDSKEIRIIYANPIAYDALINHKTYPDGAIFGKIAYPATFDPIFPNSMMPESQLSMRIQVMLHDAKHPAAIDGWRYALYARGKLDGTMSKDDVTACAACHAIAKSRGGIFALPMINSRRSMDSLAHDPDFALEFKPTSIGKLAQHLQRLLKAQTDKGLPVLAKQQALFIGSVSEFTPAAARLAVAKQAIVVVSDPEKAKMFVVAVPRQGDSKCADVIASYTDTEAIGKVSRQKHSTICNNEF